VTLYDAAFNLLPQFA